MSRIILTPEHASGCCARCRRTSCATKATWARSRFPRPSPRPTRVPRWVRPENRRRCTARLFLRPARRVTFLSRPKILRRGKKRYFCGKSPDSAMPTPSPSDQRLFEGIRFGNEADFECFFRRYYPRLVNYAARFVAGHETARDLVQDVLHACGSGGANCAELDLASLLFTRCASLSQLSETQRCRGASRTGLHGPHAG